ncbi:MAG: hypothetical protein EOO41_03080 [Methanobacteriota archaeon]|nr:MAG: hypothetical protein EOO41_03080 [Euryarchaeota archaeon]
MSASPMLCVRSRASLALGAGVRRFRELGGASSRPRTPCASVMDLSATASRSATHADSPGTGTQYSALLQAKQAVDWLRDDAESHHTRRGAPRDAMHDAPLLQFTHKVAHIQWLSKCCHAAAA